jgi:transcription antitermination factor NusG
MNWYAVRTHPGCEHTTAVKLFEKGVSVLFLRLKVRRIRKQLVTWIEAPYFPTYLFIQARHTQLGLVSSISRGRAYVISVANGPVPIPDPVMEVLKVGADQTGLILMSKNNLARARYQATQTVEFTEGPFANEIAEVVADDGGDTIQLLLKILGSWQKIAAPVQSIRAA